MKRIIDLSLAIYDKAPVWETDPETVIMPHENLKDGACNVSRLCLSSHAGTHIDAPYHFFHDGKTIDTIELSRCIGVARLLDFTAKGPRDIITESDLARYDAVIQDGARIIIYTGWYNIYPDKRYFYEMPELSIGACTFLADKNITCLALDIPSINYSQFEEAHSILLKKDILIVESLTNLGQLQEDTFVFIVLPLRIKGCDGSPCRAIAIEGFSEIMMNEFTAGFAGL